MNKQKLKEVISCSKSYRQAAKKLGTNHNQIKSWAEKLSIDISHFTHGRADYEIIGTKIGMLTINAIVSEMRENRKRIYVDCTCECGEPKRARLDLLKSGKTVSCGCHSKNRWNMVCELNPAFKGKGQIRAAYLNEIKRNAKRRNLEFNITIEQAWNLFEKQKGVCSLTGLQLKFGRVYNANETTASLDRIDNSKGYHIDNVRWVLKDINMIRGSYDSEYFVKLCNLVAKHNPRKID